MVLSVLPASAQNNPLGNPFGSNPSTSTGEQLAPTRPKLPFKRDKKEFSRQILKKAPDLPNLPQYSGHAKFLTATVAPNARSGTAFSVVYTSKDQPTQVTDWYQNVLGQYKWTILQVKPGLSIAASKDKDFVTITTATRHSADTACKIVVLYRMDKSPTD
jgi:hypothetical protein